MYPEIWKERVSGIYHDWPEYSGEQSISDLAERIIKEHQIADGDVLIGSSLGGIVACSVADKVDLRGLFLIGSAVNKEELNFFLRILSPLIDMSPVAFIQASIAKFPLELTRMFSESDPDFIRAMCKAIMKWESYKGTLKPIRIHGRKDLIIPLSDSIDNILGGGHLIAMTHSKECVQLVKTTINEIET